MGKYTGYKFNYGEYAPVEYPLSSGNYINPDEYFNPTGASLVLNTAYVPAIVQDPLNPTADEIADMNLAEISGLNPVYNIKGYDSWGNYKPNPTGCSYGDPITAAEFPFTEQNKAVQDNRASVWNLKKISLPSGGDISIQYESDDYASVQDKDVMRMFKVIGTGFSADGSDTDFNNLDVSSPLYGNGLSNKPRTYIYAEVDSDATTADVDDYLKELKQGTPIYFRFLMNTTIAGGTQENPSDDLKFDYVTGYFEYETDNANEPYSGDAEIITEGSKKYLSIPVKMVNKEGGLIYDQLNDTGIEVGVDDVHPISKATWQFGRKYLNNHVFSNQPNGDSEDIEAIVAELLSLDVINNLIEIFTGPNSTLENKNVGRRFINEKSWIRLKTKDNFKLGGGCRVKEIRMSDVWEEMNPGQGDYQTMNYGQKYEYKTVDGKSSGVATYEPVGNKENPFVQPVFSSVNHWLAPDEENFIEMPFGESFFPSPSVTYSRVSVSNVQAGEKPMPN
ncbi:MAG: hypothetical protein HRT72_12895, partial [Flavobacteriales bacterium]|nr:hypothetical protein [Flavobacteriales bacterium]